MPKISPEYVKTQVQWHPPPSSEPVNSNAAVIYKYWYKIVKDKQNLQAILMVSTLQNVYITKKKLHVGN